MDAAVGLGLQGCTLSQTKDFCLLFIPEKSVEPKAKSFNQMSTRQDSIM